MTAPILNVPTFSLFKEDWNIRKKSLNIDLY